MHMESAVHQRDMEHRHPHTILGRPYTTPETCHNYPLPRRYSYAYCGSPSRSLEPAPCSTHQADLGVMKPSFLPSNPARSSLFSRRALRFSCRALMRPSMLSLRLQGEAAFTRNHEPSMAAHFPCCIPVRFPASSWVQPMHACSSPSLCTSSSPVVQQCSLNYSLHNCLHWATLLQPQSGHRVPAQLPSPGEQQPLSVYVSHAPPRPAPPRPAPPRPAPPLL